jgi:hypothetical protein
VEKSHIRQVEGNYNDWNYDASCALTSLPILDLENFKGLIFIAQSVQEVTVLQTVAI